ncbi:MAG TPA: LON peptidase substrate-binding domain-containing protein, partial [Candidatus Hydrogenedentes bacterium]|nr:LON peptidase substrate-binding domain-containing protein [Candidatus Hydrogenedentota bacterium]
MTLSNSDNATIAPAAEFPAALPLLTMPNQVVFPMAMMPMSVSNATEVTLLEETVMGHKFVVLLTLRDPRIDNNGLDNAFEIGVIGRILQFQRQPDDSANVLIQALKRCHVEKLIQRDPYRIVQVKPLDDTPGDPDEIAPLATTVKNQMSRLIALAPSIPDAAQAVIDNIEDPGFLADLVASNLNISIPEKQRILSEVDRKRRLERLTYILAREVELMELSDKIQNDVKSAIDKGQREFFLRQQLKAIQRELGEGDSGPSEAKRYREKIEAIALKEDVKREVLREADRLEQMNESSAEYHVITTYLDWIVDLPWNVSTEDRLDIARAETILNEDHYGLDKVKRVCAGREVRGWRSKSAAP